MNDEYITVKKLIAPNPSIGMITLPPYDMEILIKLRKDPNSPPFWTIGRRAKTDKWGETFDIKDDMGTVMYIRGKASKVIDWAYLPD